MSLPGVRDGVVAISAAVAAGRTNAVEVVAEHVDRCRAEHERLNALVQPRYHEALREAGVDVPAPSCRHAEFIAI